MKRYYNIIAICIMLVGMSHAQNTSEETQKDSKETQSVSEESQKDSEDSQNVSEEPQNTTEETSEDTPDASTEEHVFTDDDLSIINSVKISSDYDLLLWLDSLGLSLQEDADAEARRSSLLEYYGLPKDAIALVKQQSQSEQKETSSTEASPSTTSSDDESTPLIQVETQESEISQGEATEIVIKHANSIDYFTFDQIDENIFTLKGDVEIIINQEGTKRQHVISTDKLVYNESIRRGTALGDVFYRVYEYTDDSPPTAPSGDAIENFSSQIIVFEIDDFSADILVGSTQIDKDIKYGKKKDKSATLNFRIYSPRISRSKDDVITVSDASFTSSQSIPPIYRILLKRMWILAPEEWAISNATIFLGNIPVMWLPFFVNPGDKFFFHPAVGYNSRNGGFFNTTTYLIGSAADKDKEDTFLDIFNFSKQSAKKKVIKGLFLREAEEGDKIYTFPKGWLLKYILDYYTGLGVYSAIDGKLSKLWYFSKLNVTGGMAFSQTVFKRKDNYFNNYINSEGKFDRNWDHGYIYNKKVPFRYLFSLDLGLEIPTSTYVSYNTSLLFEQYSDSFIKRDFSVRAEDFSWQQILDVNYDKTLLNKRKSQISSYYWKWNNSMTIHTDKWVGNYISAINISNIRIQANWNRKKMSKHLPDAYSKRIPGSSVDEKIEGFFFYPSQAEIPSYKIKVNGTFLDIDSEDLDFSNGIPKKEESDTSESDTSESDTSESDTSESDTSESDTSESDTSESDTSESDTSESDTSKSDTSESDTSKSDTSESDTSESDTSESDTSESDTSESDTSESDTSESDTSESDTSESDTSKSDTSESDTSESDTSESDTSESDTSESDTSESDTSESDTSESDTSESDTSKSDTSKSDTSESDTSESDTSESDTPTYTRPEYEIHAPFDTVFDRSADDTKESVPKESEASIRLSEVKFPSVVTYDFKWSKIKYQLNYNISHSLEQTQYFNTKKWAHPEDVPYFEPSFIRYGQFTTDNQFTITSEVTGLAEMLTYHVDFVLQLKHRSLNFDDNLTPKDRDSRKKSMDGYVREDFFNEHKISLYPLKMVPFLAKSSIQYTSNFYLGKDVFSSVKESTWYEHDDKKWWKQHAFDQTLTTDFASITQTASVQTILPPLDETITPSYEMSTDFMSFDTSFKVIKDKDTKEYKFDPWVSSISFFFFKQKLKIAQSQTYDMFGDFWEKTSTSITAWWFTGTFQTIYDNNYKFDKSTVIFAKEGKKDLRPNRLKLNLNYTSKNYRLWFDRISVKGNVTAEYTHDFLKFINNEFSLSYGLDFTINQFFVLNAKVSIKNDVMFAYFKEYSEKLGLESPRDMWKDIVNGFTFSDEQKLRESAFKLKSVSLGMSQDFGGWILNVSYSGNPKLGTHNNVKKYRWNNMLEISVSWKPLSELTSSTFYRDDAWNLEDEVK